MTIATTTEYGTDEDTEIGSRVTRSIIDNYMRRPSLKDMAITTIASMASNDLSMMRAGEDRSAPVDAAFVFIDRNHARFLISGRSAAYHFEDGKLLHRSDPKEASVMGQSPRYQPRLEEGFELKPVKNAFLAASPALAAAISDEALEASLEGMESPEVWMEKLKALVGPDKQFCAIAAFLPLSRPSLLSMVFGREKA